MRCSTRNIMQLTEYHIHTILKSSEGQSRESQISLSSVFKLENTDENKIKHTARNVLQLCMCLTQVLSLC